METKVAAGSSLHVPSVQELAKEPLATVPQRYVRSDQEPLVAYDASFSNAIPIISLQNLLFDDLGSSELQKLDLACKEWGFFQLIHHGVDSTLLEKVKVEIKDLFELPMEEKEKLWQKPGDVQGFGQHFVVSNEQKLDWADLFYMVLHPTQMRNENLFSKLPLSFRDTMESYSLEVKKIFVMLLEQITKALRITRTEEITDVFEQVTQQMRLNYYPPCPEPDLVMGLTPHSDPGGLTILLQHNEIEGLQIKKDGIWIPIKPLSNALMVNLGDSLKIMTNGIYRSIEHRAIVNKEKERLSVATFHSPDINGYLCPAPSLVTPENPAIFQRVSVVDFYKGWYLSREFKGKSQSHVETLKIKTNEGQEK